MANYCIRVDSSVKPISPEYGKSGRAATAWITKIRGGNLASGIIYYHHQGPNKAIYEGVLAALCQLESEHFWKGGTDKITIFADCKPVIDQLNEKCSVMGMQKQYDRVKSFIRRHPNVSFEFLYQNEKEDPEYKKVDILSKQGRQWIQKMMK